MGSFCISCGVSGQVIADNDKCLVIPVMQQSTFQPVEMTLGEESYSMHGVANSTCYPGCFWTPRGGFISGKYADYGCIEPDDTPTNRRAMVEFFRMLLDSAPVVTQGKNACHDVPFDLKVFLGDKAPKLEERLSRANRYGPVSVDGLDFQEFSKVWAYVWGVAQEHRLFCRNHSGIIRPLQFAAFHRVAMDYLVTYASSLKSWDGEPYEFRAFLARKLQELAAEVAAIPGTKSHEEFFLRTRLREQLNLNISDSVHGLRYPFSKDHLDLLDQHLDKGMSFDALVEAMWPSMEGVYALKAMECLNLKFSPIVTAGQDYDNSQGKALAEFISSVSEEISKEIAKRNEE